jgi:hypothetical protein
MRIACLPPPGAELRGFSSPPVGLFSETHFEKNKPGLVSFSHCWRPFATILGLRLDLIHALLLAPVYRRPVCSGKCPILWQKRPIRLPIEALQKNQLTQSWGGNRLKHLLY